MLFSLQIHNKHLFPSLRLPTAITAWVVTFTEGQISTSRRADGIRIAIQRIPEKEKRSVPQLDWNLVFPNSSLEQAEMRAERAD